MNARMRRAAHGVPGGVRTSSGTARASAATDAFADGAGHRHDAFEVRRRGDGETGLDDVHAETLEVARQPDLVGRAHAEPGGLLAISQRRVEHGDGWAIDHAQIWPMPP